MRLPVDELDRSAGLDLRPHDAADLAGCDGRVRDLLYFALLERGVFMARRGMTALSLPFGDAEVDTFVAALDDALAAHAAVLPAATIEARSAP